MKKCIEADFSSRRAGVDEWVIGCYADLKKGSSMANTESIPTVGLALQGGGAHTAFTWGVLDRLLDEVANGKLFIRAISGTSGGALNGAACAYGLNESVPEAKRALERLWRLVGASSYWHPFYNWPTEWLNSPYRWNVDLNPFVIAQGMLQQISSPYAMPWSSNPIGPIMEKVIPDFGLINRPNKRGPELYIAATNVDLTALRIFGPAEITAKALMASTCLPTLFKAIEIDGEYYWDGGYMANPALNPLVDRVDDILSVLIDPLVVKHGPPTLPRQIVNRINELSFGASWVTEVRQIELINQLCAENTLVHNGKTYTPKRFHVIRAEHLMEEIGAASKDTPCIELFLALRKAGWAAADAWVQESLPSVGKTSTFNLDALVKNRLEGTPSAIGSVREAEDKSRSTSPGR
jgi:NTE family protein